jgi:hypothetical protein
MRSGVIVDVMAKAITDDADISSEISLYHDDTCHQLAASFKREEVVGLILAAKKSSAIHRY